jgi:hypothetical protein
MVLVPTTATTSHCQLSTNTYIYISVYIHYIPTCWITTLVGKPAAFSRHASNSCRAYILLYM